MKKFCEVTVLSNEKLTESFYRVEVTKPNGLSGFEPGQFVNFYFPNSKKLFPRPFSIAAELDNAIAVIYKVIGTQTEVMRQWKPGDGVKMLLPLGNTFTIDDSVKTYLLVAGGVGIAPMMFLRDKLNHIGKKAHLCYGARTGSEFIFTNDPDSVLHLASDDGSAGFKGNVVQMLETLIDELPKPVAVYACGPDKMFEALANWAFSKDIQDVQFSMENIMACGMGLCQGCALKTYDNDGSVKISLVCKDGPVFNAREIVFDG